MKKYLTKLITVFLIILMMIAAMLTYVAATADTLATTDDAPSAAQTGAVDDDGTDNSIKPAYIVLISIAVGASIVLIIIAVRSRKKA